MDGQALVERVRDEQATELERLGSDKALLAATGADLSTGTVLGTVALSLGGLRTTVGKWADETTNEKARDAFAETAASLESEHDRVVADLDTAPAGDLPAPVETVGTFDRPVEQVAGAFVGHGLVFDGLLLQVVSFFVNEADQRHADVARDLRTSANGRIDEGATLLDSLCADDDDWDRAGAAAGDVVEAAYRDYVEVLGGMGIDPKPVC